MSAQANSLFRKEALTYHERGLGPGNLIRHTGWVRWGFWTLVFAVAGSVLAGVLINVSPTLDAPVSSFVSPTVVTMTVTSASEPPVGSAVTLGDDTGQVVAASNGVRTGTYALRVRLARPWAAGVPIPALATVRLPAQSLVVVLYRGLVDG